MANVSSKVDEPLCSASYFAPKCALPTNRLLQVVTKLQSFFANFSCAIDTCLHENMYTFIHAWFSIDSKVV